MSWRGASVRGEIDKELGDVFPRSARGLGELAD